MNDETRLVMIGMVAVAVAVFFAGFLAMGIIASVTSHKDETDVMHMRGGAYVLEIIFYDRNETRMRLERVREHFFRAGMLAAVYASGKRAYIPLDSVKYIRVLPYVEIDRKEEAKTYVD